MKQIKRHFHVIIVMLGLITMISCEDLAFGDKFLQKPPSTDVTIDTVFSTAEYARRVLWYTYQYLPYVLETTGYWTTMYLSNIEALIPGRILCIIQVITMRAKKMLRVF